MTAGYALTHARITEDIDPAFVGVSPFGVPRQQFTWWNTYEIQRGAVKGLTLGYGLFYADEQPASESVAPLMLPAYVRHDVMASYQFERVKAQLNIDNLTREEIYDAYGFVVYPRAPITVRGSLSFTF